MFGAKRIKVKKKAVETSMDLEWKKIQNARGDGVGNISYVLCVFKFEII
jgi:hypothetical protein